MNSSQQLAEQVKAFHARMLAGDSLDELIEDHKTLIQHYQQIQNERAWLLISDSLIMLYATHPDCLPFHYQQALPYTEAHYSVLNLDYHTYFWVNACGFLGNLTFKVAQNQEQVSRAYDLLKQARIAARSIGHMSGWVTFTFYLANCYRLDPYGDKHSNTTQAIDLYNQLFPHTRANPMLNVYVLNNIGLAYWNQGLLQQAQHNLEAAYSLFLQQHKVGDIIAEAKLLLNPSDSQATNAALQFVEHTLLKHLQHYSSAIKGDIYAGLARLYYEAMLVTQQSFKHDFERMSSKALTYINPQTHFEQFIEIQTLKLRTALYHVDAIDEMDYFGDIINQYEHILNQISKSTHLELWMSTSVQHLDAHMRYSLNMSQPMLEHFCMRYEQVYAYYVRQRSPHVALIAVNLGSIYRRLAFTQDPLKMLIKSEHVYMRGLEFAVPERAFMIKQNLASVYVQRAAYESHYAYKALEILQVLQQSIEQFPQLKGVVNQNLAIVYTMLEPPQWDAALDCFQTSVEVFQTSGSISDEVFQVSQNLLKAFLDRQEWHKAVEVLKTMIQSTERALPLIHSRESRLYEIGRSQYLWSLCCYCLLKLEQYAEALTYFERGTMRLLKEKLLLHSVVPEDAQDTLDRIRSVQRSIFFLEQTHSFSASFDQERGWVDLTAQELKAKRVELQTLVESFLHLPALELDDVYTALPLNTALVIPFHTGIGTAIIVLPQGQQLSASHILWLDTLMYHDLTTLLYGSSKTSVGVSWQEAYKQFVQHNQVHYWHEQTAPLLKKLWNDLFAPIAAKVAAYGCSNIIFVPALGLGNLPLGALHDPDILPINYWVDAAELSIVPSLELLVRSKQQAPPPAAEDMAFVIGVQAYQRLQPLSFAHAEAQTVAELLGVTPVLDSQISKALFLKHARSVEYLHICCHAYFDPKDPYSSGLFLSDEELISVEELLTDLHLDSCRLVTLSACETLYTEESLSQEHLGLPGVFLVSGANAVLGSIWRVSDECARLLMERFYQILLQEQVKPSTALRKAQLWLKSATRAELGLAPFDAFCPYAQPFFWAGYMIHGV